MASHWDGRFDFDHNFDSDATLVDSDNKNLDHTRGTLFSMGFSLFYHPNDWQTMWIILRMKIS